MSGHVRQRGNKGQWYAVIDVSVDGKRKRRWHKLENCKGKREAEKACERLIAQQGDGTYVEPSRITVAAFLNQWLDGATLARGQSGLWPAIRERQHRADQ